MLRKLTIKTFSSHEGEKLWFKMLVMIENMVEEDVIYISSDGYSEDLYMSVSSTLREIRRMKQEEEF